MLTKREKEWIAAIAGTCFLWLLIAGVVTVYAFAQERDAKDELAAREAQHTAAWAAMESEGCRMVACDRIGK